MATEYGVLVWVHEEFIDRFIEKLKNDPDVGEYEITEANEIEED